MFPYFIKLLEEKLRAPLPGFAAHKMMMPHLRNPERYQLQDKSKVRNGGVLILFYPDDGKIMLPLMKRPDYDGVHGGQVSFPGGKKEDGDQSLVDTALREANEEVGVDISKVTIIGTLSEFYLSASNFNVLPVVGFVNEKPNFVPEPVEVEQILETELKHLQKTETRKETELLIRDTYKLKAPYFDVQGHVVWGATAMMLSELLAVIEEIDFK